MGDSNDQESRNDLTPRENEDAAIDTDPKTLALDDLFRYAFLDSAGESLLRDEQGNPITNPSILSIGPGGMAASEAAAARHIFSKDVHYTGVEPAEALRVLSQASHDLKGGTGNFTMIPSTAEDFLASVSQEGKLHRHMALDILLARNLTGPHDALNTEKGMEAMVALGRLVRPGGLIALTYTYDAGQKDKQGGLEGEQVELFRQRLERAGMKFDTIRTGSRPHETVSPHQRSLTFPDNGVKVLRKLPPQPAA